MNIPPTVPSIYPREVQVYYVYCELSCIIIAKQIHSRCAICELCHLIKSSFIIVTQCEATFCLNCE